jgi:hypothetical protein
VSSTIRWGAASILASIVAMLCWVAAPASAASGGVEIALPAHQFGFSINPSGSLIDAPRIAPGFSSDGVMGVRNGSDAAADLSIAMVGVTSDENGCTHPEAAQGCAPGKGQLGAELVFALAVSGAQSATFDPVWTGSAADLQHGVHVANDIGSGAVRWVRLTVSLPMSSGNETQSDTFGFGLRVTLDGPGASASAGVAGVSTSRDGLGGHGGHEAASAGVDALALTGVPGAMLVGAGLLLLVSGALLVIGFRSRRAGEG